jgi:hypothetical protein
VLEHCEEHTAKELYFDNTSKKPLNTLAAYFDYHKDEVTENDLEKLIKAGVVIIPPKMRSSAIVNDMLASLIHSVQADKIFEEAVVITHLDLYYRHAFAFEFLMKSKNKKTVIEVDALTRKLTFGDEVSG